MPAPASHPVSGVTRCAVGSPPTPAPASAEPLTRRGCGRRWRRVPLRHVRRGRGTAAVGDKQAHSGEQESTRCSGVRV